MSTNDSYENNLGRKTCLIIVSDVNMTSKRAFLQKVTVLLTSSAEKVFFFYLYKTIVLVFLVFFCHNDHHG